MIASLLATFAERSLPCSLAVLGERARFCPHLPGQSAPTNALSRDETQALAHARATRTMPLGAALDSVWHSAREIETLTLVTASLAPDAIELVRSLRAKNIGVRVLLIDGAAIGNASGDKRFVGRRAQSNPPQQNVVGGSSIPVTSAAFERQKEALARAGGHVVLFAPPSAADIWPALQEAQTALLGHAAPQTNSALAGAHQSVKNP